MSVAPSTESLVEKSSFIFLGTVEKLGAAATADLEVTERTGVVKISRVLRAPEVFGELTGAHATVQLAEGQPAKLGEQAIFFAIGLSYGDGIAVQEVGRLQTSTDPGLLREQVSQVTAAIQALPAKQLMERAGGASAVIVGRVTEVRRAAGPRFGVSFHSGDWREALIQVESVEAGSVPEGIVVVAFPASRDIKWHGVPKLQLGEEGIWLLRKQLIRELGREAYVALHPLDFQPKHRLEQIRKAAGAGPEPGGPPQAQPPVEAPRALNGLPHLHPQRHV